MRFRWTISMWVTLCLLPPGCGRGTVPLLEKTVRIRILSKYRLDSLTLRVSRGRLFLSESTDQIHNTAITIVNGQGRKALRIQGRSPWEEIVIVTSPEPLTLSFIRDGKPVKRAYSGSLEFLPDDAGLIVVNTTPVEHFVHSASVAELGELIRDDRAKEGGGLWRRNLIKAMEVAVRSYILSQEDRHEGMPYRFCDLTHCVHFRGVDPEDLDSLTTGEVLLDSSGKMVTAYFHSTCGGYLSGPEVYWPGHRDRSCYRRGHDRKYFFQEYNCAGSPHFRWKALVSSSDMMKILRCEKISDITGRYRQKRVTELAYKTGDRSETIPIALFMSRAGRLLGWNAVKSNSFSIKKMGRVFMLTGQGLGHGVGMCQWGAYGMAREGFSYGDILSFYFKNTRLVQGRYRE